MGELININKVQLIKNLRNQTQLSLAECKQALEECDWDISKASDLLLLNNRNKAKRKSDRVAGESRLATYNHGGKIAVIVEISCETDFATKTKEFNEFCDAVLTQIVGASPIYLEPEDISDDDMYKQAEIINKQVATEDEFHDAFEEWYKEVCLLRQYHLSPDLAHKTIEDLRLELAAKLGENVIIRKFVRVEIDQ